MLNLHWPRPVLQQPYLQPFAQRIVPEQLHLQPAIVGIAELLDQRLVEACDHPVARGDGVAVPVHLEELGELLLDLLVLLYQGRIGAGAQRENLADGYAETESRLWEMLALYQDRMSRPYVMGKDLMAAGAEPGPLFTDALTYARKLRLAGVPKEEQLAQTMGYLRKALQKAGKKEVKCP